MRGMTEEQAERIVKGLERTVNALEALATRVTEEHQRAERAEAVPFADSTFLSHDGLNIVEFANRECGTCSEPYKEHSPIGTAKRCRFKVSRQ